MQLINLRQMIQPQLQDYAKTAISLGNVHTVTKKSNGMDVKGNGMDSNGMDNFLIYQ